MATMKIYEHKYFMELSNKCNFYGFLLFSILCYWYAIRAVVCVNVNTKIVKNALYTKAHKIRQIPMHFNENKTEGKQRERG